MIRFFYIVLSIGCLFTLLGGCSAPQPPVATARIEADPAIFPDYTGVTIPATIAPLHFQVTSHPDACAVFKTGDISFPVYAADGVITIPSADWKRLTASAIGKEIEVTVLVREKEEWKAFHPFTIAVSADPIDPYIAYRLIDPGYQLWSEMGIYQRELASFKQDAILENRQTDHNCMNCHSFCNRDPEKMLLHIRAKHGCTVLADNGRIETLDTKTEHTLSALVYPSWHPSGKYIAFSVNNTTQETHPVHRTEVFDKASDVVVYDVEKKEVFTAFPLFSPGRFETFPTFSPDGKTLYFCSAPALPVPDSLQRLQYSLCKISFDPDKCRFGTVVDTLYRAETNGKSILFPRLSPDGRFLLATVTAYGTFPIWHKDADLYMLDLVTGEAVTADAANSADTESYHSWSSNGKWVVFSSRRIDGLYTLPFIAHVDERGVFAKPFLLPQASPGYYTGLTKSYNIPEFVKGKVKTNPYRLATKVKEGKHTSVSFAQGTRK